MDREIRQRRFASHRPRYNLSSVPESATGINSAVHEPLSRLSDAPTTPSSIDYDGLRERIARLSSSPSTPPLPSFTEASLPDTVSTEDIDLRLSKPGDSSSLSPPILF